MMRTQLNQIPLRHRPHQDADDDARRGRKKLHEIRCNLCHESFAAASRFMRFCPGCKAQSELFRFYESLPCEF